MPKSVIIGTGSFLPDHIQKNEDFSAYTFYDEKNQLILKDSVEVTKKLSLITGIEERRYIDSTQNTSDIAAIAGLNAIADSKIDPESLDYIIMAHNFGDVSPGVSQAEIVPSLANRIKQKLGIVNPDCVAYDLIFGCPGWLQAVIHADAFGKAGLAKRFLIIGADSLSRVSDKHDRDSLIYADGAGACILEYQDVEASDAGIIATASRSFSTEEADFINMGRSFCPESDPDVKYLKMKGRKVYEFAMNHVPTAMKICLDKANVDIKDLKKVFIHQANEKMDEAILKRFYQLYDVPEPPEDVMPMSIRKFGNSSVATIPTLYDAVRKGLMPPHNVQAGDVILFASVGAGMNINAVCYTV